MKKFKCLPAIIGLIIISFYSCHDNYTITNGFVKDDRIIGTWSAVFEGKEDIIKISKGVANGYTIFYDGETYQGYISKLGGMYFANIDSGEGVEDRYTYFNFKITNDKLIVVPLNFDFVSNGRKWSKIDFTSHKQFMDFFSMNYKKAGFLDTKSTFSYNRTVADKKISSEIVKPLESLSTIQNAELPKIHPILGEKIEDFRLAGTWKGAYRDMAFYKGENTWFLVENYQSNGKALKRSFEIITQKINGRDYLSMALLEDHKRKYSAEEMIVSYATYTVKNGILNFASLNTRFLENGKTFKDTQFSSQAEFNDFCKRNLAKQDLWHRSHSLKKIVTEDIVIHEKKLREDLFPEGIDFDALKGEWEPLSSEGDLAFQGFFLERFNLNIYDESNIRFLGQDFNYFPFGKNFITIKNQDMGVYNFLLNLVMKVRISRNKNLLEMEFKANTPLDIQSNFNICRIIYKRKGSNTDKQLVDDYYNGIYRFQQGKYQNAIQRLDKVIEIMPTYNKALFYRGYAEAKLGQLEKAEKDLSIHIHLNPRDGAAYYIRSTVRISTSNFEGSIADLNKAIKYIENGKSANDKKNLSSCYFIRGQLMAQYKKDYKQGCRDLKKAKRLGMQIPASKMQEICN